MSIDKEIELRHLRYFLAVAEELHFGQAAKRLHVAQPPLSQQIRQLERMLGHDLFVRTSRSVKLTQAGEVMVERARRTLAKVQEDVEAVQRVGRGEDGSLTVGFVESAILSRLPAVLGRYRATYPKVQLKLHEFHTRQLVDALRNGLVDAGLARDAGPEDWLRVEPVVIEPYILVAAEGHRFARQESVAWAELKDEPWSFSSGRPDRKPGIVRWTTLYGTGSSPTSSRRPSSGSRSCDWWARAWVSPWLRRRWRASRTRMSFAGS
ncbi:MAG: LysR substrate-binding domain-containing protein [Paludibaculum sp.]